MTEITYRQGNALNLEQVIDLYRASTLGERRPIENSSVMQDMLANASLVISAWDGDRLVGISRTLTDFAYVAYLADLAVHLDYQHQGIGSELVQQTRAAVKPTCFLTLLSAPAANDFYPKIGFEQHPRAWVLDPCEDPFHQA